MNWYVDEAGDPTLFAHRGRVVVGEEGCSRFFILGKLECADVDKLEREMTALRQQLLADPYLNKQPSMRLDRPRTAVMFHAKNDLPEVRYEVYRLLAMHELRFVAVVCDKHRAAGRALASRLANPMYRYDAQGNELYDDLTRQLFSRPHNDVPSAVVYAQRGFKARTQAFENAILHGEQDLERMHGTPKSRVASVVCGQSKDVVGLQACDYYLWALQRFYERAESRYLDFIWPQTLEILDPDAELGVGQSTAGVYDQKHPLTLESRAGVGIKNEGLKDIG